MTPSRKLLWVAWLYFPLSFTGKQGQFFTQLAENIFIWTYRDSIYLSVSIVIWQNGVIHNRHVFYIDIKGLERVPILVVLYNTLY